MGRGRFGVISRDGSPKGRIDVTPGRIRPTASSVLAACLPAIVVALLFRGVLAGRLLFWMDIHQTFEPLFAMLGDGLSSGRILWTSLIGAGKPMLANPTVAACYPPNLLFAVLPAPLALSLLTVLHVLAGSYGALVLARRLELGDGASLASGVVYAGAGATLSATPFVGLSWSLAWLPWLVLLSDRVATRQSTVRSMAWLGVVGFMMLTLTEPMMLAAAALGTVLVLAERGISVDGIVSDRVRDHLILPGVAALAACIAASPYLVALAVNLPDSVRALGFTAEGVTIWSLHPLRLLEAVAPGVFGALGKPAVGALWAGGLAPVKGFFYIPSLYLGAPVVALVAAGVARRSRWRISLSIWLGILALLALGRWGPIYPWLEGLPGADIARYPVKWMVAAVVPLCLLAGVGIRNLELRDPRCRRVFLWSLILVTVLLVVTAGAIRLPWFGGLINSSAVRAGEMGTHDVVATVQSACIRGLLPALAAIGLSVLTRNNRLRGGILTVLLVVLIAVDLVSANGHLIATTTPEFYSREPEALRVVRADPRGVERIRVDENSTGIGRWVIGHPSLEEIARFQRQILTGYVAADFRVPVALTRDIEATGPAHPYLLKVLAETAPPREQAMIYGSAAITHLVTDRSIEDAAFEPLGVVRTSAGSTLHVYRNTLARPRVALAGAVIPYRGDDGYRRVVSGSSADLFENAVLIDADDLPDAPAEIEALIPRPGFSSTGRAGTASIVADEGHRLAVRAESDAPVVLVVSDAYLPQWTAKIDDAEARLFRVNYAFRGVLVESGDHIVELEYHPWQW